MTTFDDRQRGFENKYAHDEENAFKIDARQRRMFGMWAAEKLGLSGKEAEDYAHGKVLERFERHGDDELIASVLNDFSSARLDLSERDLRIELERLHAAARHAVENED